MELGQQLFDFVEACDTKGLTVKQVTQAVRKEFVCQILARNNFNQVRTAAAMGVHRNTLSRLLRELAIDVDAMKQARKQPARVESPVNVQRIRPEHRRA